jgi:CelD/BcsL family acetyltransferase involved in cellulose biosynthesis
MTEHGSVTPAVGTGRPSTRAAGPVVLETITDPDAFEALENAGWDDLVRAMSRPSPFMLHPWLREWWRTAATGSRLAVQVAFRDGRLVAALPFVVRPSFGVKIGELMGGNSSPLGDLLMAPGEPDETGRSLLARARSGEQHLVDLFGLPGESRLSSLLPEGDLRLIRRVDAPMLDLRPGWPQVYEGKTSSKTRNLHRRRRRQLSELGTLEVVIARTADELDAAITDAFRLHERRWAGRPDGSNFGTPTGQIFHRAAVRALAASDVPRIVLLKLDGRAIAFHYYLAFCGCMYVHRLAFEPALSRYSPGLVNTLDAIAAAADEGLTRVEYLGGTERYKADLSDGPAPLYQGIGMVSGPLGRVVAFAHERVIEGRKRMRSSKALRSIYFEGFAPARRVSTRLRHWTGDRR